ncbi:hypothetical protein [Haliea sp. E17]|uniref:hypothetical protein n=1 Tax=Haliea sp. E17 TaxID=3401576 RepID=UPI003AB0D7EF
MGRTTFLVVVAAGLITARLAFVVQAEASGPDFFAVAGVPADTPVQLHAGPAMDADVVGELGEAEVVRNLGCEETPDNMRWCRVGTLADESVDGWVLSRYLSESAPPPAEGEGRVLSAGDKPGQPAVYQRASGEFEVNFQGGCGALFARDGSRITAGSSCSADQLQAAEDVISSLRQP